MIHFKCPHCQTSLQMEIRYAGQAVLCPTCNGQILVPYPNTSGRFLLCICAHCKAVFQIPAEQAGSQVPCPQCRQMMVIPGEENVLFEGQMIRFSCRSCQQAYCLPSRYAGRKFTCPACRHACFVPKPAKPEGDDLILLEEKPPKVEQTGPLPSELETKKPEPARMEIIEEQSEKPKKSILFKAVVGTICAVLGFSAAFWLISSFQKNAPTNPEEEGRFVQEEPSSQNVLQAVNFSRTIITQLNRKSKDVKELIYLFPDEAAVPESAIQTLVQALDIGRFSSLETTIEKARVRPGASYFITKSTAVSDTGNTRIIRIGFVEILNNPDSTSSSMDHLLFGITIFDEKGAQLASAGQSDPTLLASKLDETVNQYALPMPDISSNKIKIFSEAYNQFVRDYFCPIAIVFLLVILVTLISIWVVFDKAGEPGWAAFVPIYNTIVLARIGGKSEWLGLLCALSPMVPLVGSILNLLLFLYLSIGVAQAFGKGTLFGVGLVFLPFIFFPILAFSESAYPEAGG